MKTGTMLMTLLAACGGGQAAGPESSGMAAACFERSTDQPAPLAVAADQRAISIAAGRFWIGSSDAEREQAYLDYRASAGHDGARRGRWFDRESPRQEIEGHAFRMDETPVTNAMFSEFLRDTGCPWPRISEEEWKAQRFSQDYADDVVPKLWSSRRAPAGREQHPVVLVSQAEATAYCQWRGERVGRPTRLPSEQEFERAARAGTSTAYYWGDDYDPSKLNSQVAGPRDTTAVASFEPNPAGLYDMAGNIFHWTRTPWGEDGARFTVKGSAWDDYGGLGRPAARHGRRAEIRHAIVGFRCVVEAGSTGREEPKPR